MPHYIFNIAPYNNTILCSSSGAYSGYISRYDTEIWASDCFSIQLKDNMKNLTNEDYIFLYLKSIQDKIYKEYQC